MPPSREAGGSVYIGPVSNTEATADDIRHLSVKKFLETSSSFDKDEQYTLVYPDGRPVDDLPDGYTKFTTYC